MAIEQKIKNNKLIANISLNLGADLFEMKKFDEALRYFNTAKKAYEALNNLSEIAIVCGNISSIYAEKNDYKNALKYSF